MKRLTLPLCCAAAVLLSGLVACQRHPLPASPVPGILTKSEALSLADAHLDALNLAPRTLTRIESTGEGYLLSYQTAFDPALRPPKESHLVVVHHDGEVFDLAFAEEQ